MTVELAGKWLGAAALIISLGNTLWAILMRDARLNYKAIQQLQADVVNHDRRIQTVEHEVRHLPDKEEVIEIKVAVVELKGVMARLEQNLGGVTTTVHRIDDYLRNQT